MSSGSYTFVPILYTTLKKDAPFLLGISVGGFSLQKDPLIARWYNNMGSIEIFPEKYLKP